jgi:hypothetical protein
MSQQVVNNADVGLQARFDALAQKWKEETRILSSSSAIASHPAYLAVIAMGASAVPLILRNMEREGGHWFEALTAITGEDPIPREHWGDIPLMKQDWLAWGRVRGLL